MVIFLITPLDKNAANIETAVKAHIPERDSYKLQNDAGWFVLYHGTTVELSNLLGITGQISPDAQYIGAALVTPVTSYYGRGVTDMWEWLKTRFERL